LGVAGAVMAYLSGEDARRGNAAAYKTKICQSKALTLTGLGIGLLAIIAIVCAVGSFSYCIYLLIPNVYIKHGEIATYAIIEW